MTEAATIQSPMDLPGYAAAIHRERFGRDVAFLDVPENINGFSVLPMTLRHFVALRVINSPMLPPFRTPSPLELAAFLWILNPNYRADDDTARAAFMKQCRRFMPRRESRLAAFVGRFISRPKDSVKWSPLVAIKRILTLPIARHEARQVGLAKSAAATLAAAREYVTDTMSDKPPAVQNDYIQGPDYYSDICSVISSISREKHYSESELLNMPLRRIFQHLREQRDVFNHSVEPLQRLPLGNPSDKIINDFITPNANN